MSQTQTLPHTDSTEAQDARRDESKKTKTRRPANTAFRQQRLKAWQPILTPKTVLPLFFAVGVIFAPIGGLLLWASSQVEEISINYTHCYDRAPLAPAQFVDIPTSRVTSYFKPSNYTSYTPAQWRRSERTVNYGGPNVSQTICSLQFDISNDIGPPVYFYYRLTNFYQNHRRYVKSLDTVQLMGEARTYEEVQGGGCDPLQGNETRRLPYYPCGLIANSLFNDTFESPVLTNNIASSSGAYNMTKSGIAWDSDKDLYKKSNYNYDQALPPPNWRVRYPNGYTTENPIPNLQEDESFQVWMRTAGLPTFSKLAMRNDTAKMRAGRYQVDIVDNFPVTTYGGTKSILISTRTVMGGKNPFLGIAYVVVGGICIILGALFTAAHLIKPRKLGDHRYLTWNNEQPSTATTTGRSVGPGDAA